MTFLPVVILAIDPGAVAGWAIFRAGVLVRSGSARTVHEREVVVCQAVAVAADAGCPLVVVAETWRPMKSHVTMLGMGAAWGLWLAELQRCGVPARRILRVVPEVWRKACYGTARVPREEAKPKAIDFVARCYRTEAGPDEAEAICIGAWGSEAEAELRFALGVQALRALGVAA